MGFTCTLLAISNNVPRQDIASKPARKPRFVGQAVEELWPGRWRFDSTGTMEDAFASHDDSLWVGIWGDTAVFSGEFVLPVVPEEPTDRFWALVVHSVVDACTYRTPRAHASRIVNLYSGSTAEEKRAALSGDGLLPFEVPFARGEHDLSPDTAFNPLALGDSAMLYLFGTIGESPLEDDFTGSITPVMPWDIPMHRFVAPSPGDRPKGLFKRLFG